MFDELAVVCGKSHRFWGRESILLSDLSGERMILRELGSGTRAQIEEPLKSHHIPYEVSWECTDSDAIKTAVRDGHGITVISRRLLEQELKTGDLWALKLSNQSLMRNFDLVWHKNKVMTDVLQGFLDITRAYGLEADREKGLR